MDAYLGEIRLFPYTYNPQGWFWCEGQTLSIQQYPALYSLLATTYGGDGKTTFKLPDLRGQAVVGASMTVTSPPGLTRYPLNTKVGQVQVTAPLASHNHRAVGGTGAVPGATPTAKSVVTATQANFDYAPPPMANQVQFSSDVLSSAVPALGPNGVAAPHTNIQPYLTLQFAICWDGLYPIYP